MSDRSIATEATVSMAPSRGPRLVPYCLIAVGCLGGTIITGQPALAALAVPFALALAVGLRVRGPLRISSRLSIDSDQVLEGDAVAGRLELEWHGVLDASVVLHHLRGVAPESAASRLAWSLAGTSGRIELPIELRATEWGRHEVGEVWVRLQAPFGLLTWTGRLLTGPALRVLPARERLTRLLEPPESPAALGMHRSRRRGDGLEFAELRPYAPGDRLRDLNWGATARHRRPFVNDHHRELSGDVVIAIDAFVDGSRGSSEALARAARAAWALASIHLRANDRVGVVGLGSRTRWLPPAGGRRAQYRLLETMLRIGGNVADATPAVFGHERHRVPASALFIALTPLHDLRTVRTLREWRGRGRSVAVAVIDTRDLLGEPASPAEGLALRLWSMELDRRRRELADLGIPIVSVPGRGSIAPVISALRRARRAPGLRRGR